MLGKLTQNPALAAHAQKMSDISLTLAKENQAYEEAKLANIDARVDVKFVDLTTDTPGRGGGGAAAGVPRNTGLRGGPVGVLCRLTREKT